MAIKFETAAKLSALSQIRHGFFMRCGGITTGSRASLNCGIFNPQDLSSVFENRQRALAAVTLAAYSLVIPRLAHGNNVLIIDENTNWRELQHEQADAVITTSLGIALGITYADCLPILVASRDQRVIAAIHAGWRGLQCGVIRATMSRLRTEFDAHDLVAAIGPAISLQGFTVTDDVLHYFQQTWPAFVVSDGAACGNVDLSGIARQQLLDENVLEVEKVGGYTDLDSESYYSHRRDGGATGRHLAVIAKKIVANS